MAVPIICTSLSDIAFSTGDVDGVNIQFVGRATRSNVTLASAHSVTL